MASRYPVDKDEWATRRKKEREKRRTLEAAARSITRTLGKEAVKPKSIQPPRRSTFESPTCNSGLSLARKNSWAAHMELHRVPHGDGFRCLQCSGIFESAELLIEHDKICPTPPIKTRAEYLEPHQVPHGGGYKCLQCFDIFESIALLIEHDKTHLTPPMKTRIEGDRIQCLFCDITFVNFTDYTRRRHLPLLHQPFTGKILYDELDHESEIHSSHS